MAETAKRGAKAVLRAGFDWALQYALGYIIPIAVGAVTVIAGWADGLPWFYIIIGTVFAVAVVITAMLRLEELVLHRSLKDKLSVTSYAISTDLERTKTGKPQSIKKAVAMFYLQNLGWKPISYIVDEISSSVDGRINPKPTYKNRGGTISPGATRFFRDDPIDMQETEIKDALEGTLKFKLRYGRPGSEKLTLERTVTLTAPLDRDKGGYPTTYFQDTI